MWWFRRRERDSGVKGRLDGPRITFPEFLVWVGVVLFFLLTLLPIFFPTWVPPSFGFAEVGTPGSSGYVPPKTLWDWFGLVAIPLAIVVVGYVLNRADRNHERRLQDQRLAESRELEQSRVEENRKTEEERLKETRELEAQRIAENRKIEEERLKEARELEHERAQDAIVKDYLDQMTDLLLNQNYALRDSTENDEVRSVARARTLTALRGVDGGRKATMIQFLYEVHLIRYMHNEGAVDAVVNLNGADLSETVLTGVTLPWADLGGVKLGGVDLTWADLSGAMLTGAKLEEAKLQWATLTGADLTQAWLEQAILRGSKLEGAMLTGAKLEEAKLQWATLTGADLTGAKLQGADLTGADLRGAKLPWATLTGAWLQESFFTGADLTGADLFDCRDVTLSQLLQAQSLHGAILPDYTDPADLGDKWSPPQDESNPEPSTPVQ